MASDWPFDDDGGAVAESTSNVLEYSVSELSFALKRTVEETYGYVRVRGELGRVSRPGSGHVYLDLKDDKAVMAGVIWKGVASRLKIQPEQGLEVVVTGKLTTYPGQSKYQIVIEAMEPAGVGALMALLEERRKKLAAEGLFDDARKQEIPYLPRVIGVVTSPTGAVIRDILHRLGDRFPSRVIVWPVRVQGETSGEEVASAIRGFNALQPDGAIARPDLLIVARGGGSLEDLWGFNDEAVVRAAAESEIPLISAVGHETDWTLIDHAADERAPTPTAAAERAVPVRAELIALVDDLSRRKAQGLLRLLEERKSGLRAAVRGLLRRSDLLSLPQQRLDTVGSKLKVLFQTNTQGWRVRFETTTSGNRLVRALSSNTQVSRSRFNRVAALYPRLDYLLDQPRRRLEFLSEGLRSGFITTNLGHRAKFDRAAAQLSQRPLERKVRQARELADGLSARAARGVRRRLEISRSRYETPAKLLGTLSYRSVLARGFALVRDAGGAALRSAAAATPGAAVTIEFHDGSAAAHIDSDGSPPREPKRSRPSRAPAADDEQGNLF